MKLDRVTITGADGSIRPHQLIELTRKYPFVEWGILVSKAQEGMPRYPTIEWIRDLQTVARTEPMALSLHLCGRYVRQLLIGTNEMPAGLADGFERIQLNFHAERVECSPIDFARALDQFGKRAFIFQIDEANGNGIFEAMLDDRGDVYPLFDTSGGAGILPGKWPQAMYEVAEAGQQATDAKPLYHGYAGGLGPHNLAEQIPLIAKAAGEARFWVDMETKVRSRADRQFDLEKVEACLKLAAPFVQPEGVAA